MEEGFLFDRIDGDAGNISMRDKKGSRLVAADSADAITARGDFAAVAAGIAEHPVVILFLVELSLAKVSRKEIPQRLRLPGHICRVRARQTKSNPPEAGSGFPTGRGIVPAVKDHRARLSFVIERDLSGGKSDPDSRSRNHEELLEENKQEYGSPGVDIDHSLHKEIERNSNTQQKEEEQMKSKGGAGVPEEELKSAAQGFPRRASVPDDSVDPGVVGGHEDQEDRERKQNQRNDESNAGGLLGS
jgi:hypothetical protein